MVALLSVDPRAAADIRVMILDGESGGPYRLAARDALLKKMSTRPGSLPSPW